MKSKVNPICAACPDAINSINGRYCCKLRQHVEYASSAAPCGITPTNNSRLSPSPTC